MKSYVSRRSLFDTIFNLRNGLSLKRWYSLLSFFSYLCPNSYPVIIILVFSILDLLNNGKSSSSATLSINLPKLPLVDNVYSNTLRAGEWSPTLISTPNSLTSNYPSWFLSRKSKRIDAITIVTPVQKYEIPNQNSSGLIICFPDRSIHAIRSYSSLNPIFNFCERLPDRF